MTTIAPHSLTRMPLARARPSWVMAAVEALVVLALRDAGARPLLLVAVPLALVAATIDHWPRGAQAAGATLAGVLIVGGGLLAHAPAATLAGAAALALGLVRGWGVNAGRSRRRAWAVRGLTAAGAVLAAVLVVYPVLLAVNYVAKPRRAITDSALALPHTAVAFRASDGVPLSGWWIAGRTDRAVVLVHGGGGDRMGAIAHARMLHRAGFGVLLYDARGRGPSGGRQNAFGWRWDRDVRGAVDVLAARGIRHIGLLGLSTGAEAVITEAAGDRRVEGVVADGVQARTTADIAELPTGERIASEPLLAVASAAIGAVSGERRPAPLARLVPAVAATRPLLMVATVPIERTLQVRYTQDTAAQVWQLPRSGHTQGLADHPAEYARRVTAVLGGR